MALQKLRSLAVKLEDPEHPLLGPNVKSLCLFGLWQTGSTFQTVTYYLVHFLGVLLAVIQAVDIFIDRHDLNKVLNNMSISVVLTITVIKCVSYLRHEKDWKALISEISSEELKQLRKQDSRGIITTKMEQYKKYTRIVTYLYWMLVLVTYTLMVMTPLLKYGSSKTYRDKIRIGDEPLPQIMSSWFPFDHTKMPGYMLGVCFHVFVGGFECGNLAVYDMSAVAIMSYLKGQAAILKWKCKNIFKGTMSRKAVVDNIKECHRHHSVLVKHYKMFNDLLSPIMLLYVLVSSITICCSVIQFNMSNVTKSQKVWVIQYSAALVLQLFMFCWHGNEVIFETRAVDRGVYESDWWKGDKHLRRLIMMLAAKLNASLKLNAGPFTTLSIPAFITIMKGSYSFYTLFSQMQTNK